MNILLIYATNSGGTEMLAQEITQKLSSGNSVTMKRTSDVSPDDVKNSDLIVLGTPSWDFDGKEGQPHEDYFPMKDRLTGGPFSGKKVAIFGLGDSSYKHFNGGVDVLEQWVSEWQAQKVTDSYRVDKFFSNQPNAVEGAKSWCDRLLQAVK